MSILKTLHLALKKKLPLLAILIDPEKFAIDNAFAKAYLEKIPSQTTHFLVGGSTDPEHKTEAVVQLLKNMTHLPVLIFPGSHHQITNTADGILFLSLLSGRNPEYLIEQQLAAVPLLRNSQLEIIPTAYMLIDGGSETAVARISRTQPMSQDDLHPITNTALAGEFMGKQCVYLEAGSGAKKPVLPTVITAVRDAITIPLIVGGGIRSERQMQEAFSAGATMVVIGTAFEEDSWSTVC